MHVAPANADAGREGEQFLRWPADYFSGNEAFHPPDLPSFTFWWSSVDVYIICRKPKSIPNPFLWIEALKTNAVCLIAAFLTNPNHPKSILLLVASQADHFPDCKFRGKSSQ